MPLAQLLCMKLKTTSSGTRTPKGFPLITRLVQIFNDSGAKVRSKLFGIYGLLIAINVLAWVWALVAFRHHPVLLGTALLAYGFGLRHAVDADHIAAIDNVTRKLMQEKKRPVTVGFFFSLGHSWRSAIIQYFWEPPCWPTDSACVMRWMPTI